MTPHPRRDATRTRARSGPAVRQGATGDAPHAAPPPEWHAPLTTQLLKWVGNKHRIATQIVAHFPPHYERYVEPFLGSGAVLATLAPRDAYAGDALGPLIGIFRALQERPEALKQWYSERWNACAADRRGGYEEIRRAFNDHHRPSDLVYLSRSCYGGIVRFRRDGAMTTPCGPHPPITPTAFNQRVDAWHARTRGARFVHADYRATMSTATKGDICYLDPPFAGSSNILYGAQDFRLADLYDAIEDCKKAGADVALSIDGTGTLRTPAPPLHIPPGLFDREILIDCGKSLLRNLQRSEAPDGAPRVRQRLLLTY